MKQRRLQTIKMKINSVYIVMPEELTVIAAAKNMDNIFIIQNSDLSVDEDAVCQALNHLYKKGFIENKEGEALVLQDDLEDLIQGMEQARSIMIIRRFGNLGYLKNIYISSRFIVVEQRRREPSGIRLYEIPKQELKDFLEDDYELADTSYRDILDEERLISDGMKKKEVLLDSDVEGMGNVHMLIELVAPHDNRIKCRMLARRDDQWLQYRQELKTIEKMEQEEFVNNIKELIEEQE